MQLYFELLAYIMFVGISVMCIRFARLMFGSYLNVTCVLIFPFIIICSLQVFAGLVYSNFIFPCVFYWVILMIFVIATLLSESLAYKLFRIDNNNVPIADKECVTNKLFMPLVLCYLLYMIYDTYRQISSVDISMILQDEFVEDYGGSGGYFSRLFLIICCTFFLGFAKKWHDYVLGFLCLIPSLVINTKGIIFMPILASFFVKAYRGVLTNIISKVVIAAFIGIIVFFSSYFWESFAIGGNPFEDTSKLKQISEKFLFYMLAGVQGFNINIVTPIDNDLNTFSNITLAPFSNFMAKFGFGESVSMVNPISRTLGVSSEEAETNVNTYFGTLYLYNGIIKGLIIHVFWVFLTNGIKKCTQITKNVFIVTLFGLFLSGFALGWFEFYFMHTFWIYFIIIVLVLYIFFQNKQYIWK